MKPILVQGGIAPTASTVRCGWILELGEARRITTNHDDAAFRRPLR